LPETDASGNSLRAILENQRVSSLQMYEAFYGDEDGGFEKPPGFETSSVIPFVWF